MASIILRGRRYRAEVARLGIRRSSSFNTFEEARAWAVQLETEILGRAPTDRFGLPPAPVHEIEAAEVIAAGLIMQRGEILGLPKFRPACGIYFLINEDEIVYVGKSVDLHRRVAEHYAHWKQFDCYTYIACLPEQLDQLERHYIRDLRPSLNVAGVPNG